MCAYMQSPTETIKYKGHILTTELYSKGGMDYGMISIVDGRYGFHTRTDALEFINGYKPKHGIINL